MFNAVCLITLLVAIASQTEALDSEKCKVSPPEQHCIIEYASRDRWPHTERYTFVWRTQKCILIRWSNACETPAGDTNNFASESECTNECGGWA